jgi:hypothetical protein
MESRSKFCALEALCLLYARLKTAADEHDLAMKYDHSQSAISEVVNELIGFLDGHWKHLLDFDYHHLLSPENLAHYAQAISCAGTPLQTIWSFIDCTLKQMCRLSCWQ